MLFLLLLHIGIPILAEDTDNLNNLSVSNTSQDSSLKWEFFDSLKNAKNLSTLTLSRTYNLKITSLLEYLNDELPSVSTVVLSGSSTGNPQNYLKDLKGIEKFTNLKVLTINNTSDILDISAIKNCPTLTSVTLGYCNIQSLSGIEGLTNLQSLTINNNNITSLKPLENLKNLTSLNLQNNAISDTSSYVDTDGSTKTYRNLDILAGLHTSNGGKLISLYLSGNDNIIDYSPVSSLTWSNKSGF